MTEHCIVSTDTHTGQDIRATGRNEDVSFDEGPVRLDWRCTTCVPVRRTTWSFVGIRTPVCWASERKMRFCTQQIRFRHGTAKVKILIPKNIGIVISIVMKCLRLLNAYHYNYNNTSIYLINIYIYIIPTYL